MNEISALVSRLVKRHLDKNVKVEYTDVEGFDGSTNFIYDYSKARREFGYLPVYDVEGELNNLIKEGE